jgi:hypothetical protein
MMRIMHAHTNHTCTAAGDMANENVFSFTISAEGTAP